MKVTFLGTGTSVGVPVIGCDCEVCRSENPRDTRTRSSVHVEQNGTSFVIDTSVDFRHQMIREDIDSLDFILFTHAHADHIMGLDDVRPVNSRHGEPIDAYAQPRTVEEIRKRFDYIFQETPNNSWKPRVTLSEITSTQTIDDVEVTPIPVRHGNIEIYGYRIGDFAYLSDVSHIPESAHGLLEDLEVLVLDALRDREHPTHFTIDQSIEAARRIGADRTFTTHMTHDVGHRDRSRRLPEDVEPAYDGLAITVNPPPQSQT